MARASWLTGVLLLTCSVALSEERIVFETDSLRLTVGSDGTVQSLVSRASGKEYMAASKRGPMAAVSWGGRAVPRSQKKNGQFTERWIYQGGHTAAASRLTLAGDRLQATFGEAGAMATWRVISRPNYLAFELLEVAGREIDRIDWLCLNLVDLPQQGAWVNFAFEDSFGVCLCAGNVRTNVEMDQAENGVAMRAVAERVVGFQGPTAVLFGCPAPRDCFLDAMAVVERDFGLPAGAENRRRSEARCSYLWASRPTPENVGDYVSLAKRAGFRMVLLSYTAFSTGAGHFAWRKEYPNGMADLKKVTDTIRAAGLAVGWHIHYSKAHISDRYVTPVPDERLHQVRRFALAEAIDTEAKTIPVDRNPAGCTLDARRRVLKLGKELVAYEGYRTESPFAFTGCRRGHLGTTASQHEAGDGLGLLDVDTWPDFIRFDQDTDIQDEVARRIGEIYRQTGPYAMVYFDGAEDVHAPFWYHVASAQQRVYRCLDPAPPVCESALYSHFSWHAITRSNAYDIVAPAEGMKDFCRLMPCPTAAERTKDFSRIDFGWLGRFGQRGAGPDVWEYVASRAAAWDCPISLKASPAEIRSNPRWEDCLDAIRTWEEARLGDHLTESQRVALRNVLPEEAHYVPCFDQRGIWEKIQSGQGLTDVQQRILARRQEHHLFRNELGEYELAPISELPLAGGKLKAYHIQRRSRPDEIAVLLWAVDADVELRFASGGRVPHAMRPFGQELPVRHSENETVVTIGGRTYLVFREANLEEVTGALREAAASAGGL